MSGPSDQFSSRLIRLYAMEGLAGLLRIAALVVLARALGDSEFGIYSLVLGLILLASQLGSLGTAAAAGYFAAHEAGRGIVRRALLLNTAVSVATAPITIMAIWLYARQNWREISAPQIVLLAATAGVLSAENAALHIIRGRRRLAAAGSLAFVRQAALMAVAVSILLAGGSADVALLGFGLVTIAMAGLAIVSARSQSPARVSDVRTHRIFRYGLESHASTVVTLLSYRLDLLLVGAFLTSTEAGLYAAVLTIDEALWFFSFIAASVVVGQVADADVPTRQRTIEALSRAVITATLFACLAVLVAAPWMLRLFGHDFESGRTALTISLVGVLALALSRVLATYRAAQGRPASNLPGSIAGLVVNITLNLLLIPRFGIEGAALATAISFIVVAGERIWDYRKSVGKGAVVRLFVPRRDDFYRLLTALRKD